MSAQFYRKYIDIINENSQPKILDEGMMDSLKMLVPKVMKFLGGDTVEMIANKVKEITGGDYTPSKENAIKVAQALGFDKAAGAEVSEGIAGNWQGKLLQLVHLAGVGGAAAQMIGGEALTGMQGGFASPGLALVMVGTILLMVTNTFWSGDRDMIGAMGHHGNKGWETGKGPHTR